MGEQDLSRLEIKNEYLVDKLITQQQQAYEDMKNFAHQFAKLATDMMNAQMGTAGEAFPPPTAGPMGDEQQEMNFSLTGGEIGN